ncbi:MAG: c-type cytochrome [Acidobacteriia bacterium]|nr:c-type cytochrome [Terriglobia bacterium]
MRAPLDLFCLLRRVGLESVGMIVFVMAIFMSSWALAQRKNASAGEIKQSTYAALAGVPEEARERKNPFEGNPQAVAVGRKLFEQHCAECHGKKAEGTRKAPSLLREEVQQATPGTLFWILTNGVVRQGMPVWSKLPEPQRWQIVTFLGSLSAHPMHANQ